MMSFERFRVFVTASSLALALLLVSCGDDRVPPVSPCPSTFDQLCPTPTGDACVLVTSDPNNCGACGNRCAVGMMCRASACVMGSVIPDAGPGLDLGPPGACSPSCPSTQRCCGTSCVTRMVVSGTDGRADPSFRNCGGCGTMCDAMTASACSGTACSCGTLGRACAAGQICTNTGGGFTCQANCGTLGGPCPPGATCCGAGDEGMCLNTMLDTFNCGRCGNVCGAGTACSAGVCAPLCGATVCATGQLCCSGTCATAGVANCGGCGITCVADDICGAPFGGSGLCCGPELFLGFVEECSVPVDAGTPDAGTPDAGTSDASTELDASELDASAPDAA